MNGTHDSAFYAAVAAMASLFAAGASGVVGVLTFFQLKHARLSHGVNLITKFEEQFSDQTMLEARKLAAGKYLARNCTDEIDVILDFFETIGMFVRRGVVDKELVWNSFSYWILRYHALSRAHIRERRKEEDDATGWQEFIFLVKCMKKIEQKKRKLKSEPKFSREALDSFLRGEVGS